MTIYKIYQASTFPFYEVMIKYLRGERTNTTNEELLSAMNLNIILNSACYIEGQLEAKLKIIIQEIISKYYKHDNDILDIETRKPVNIFMNNIEEDLKKKISQCTGIDKYDDLFQILLNKSFKKENSIAEILEGIQVLFQLRNVIAHGKEINAYEVQGSWTNGLEENFIGGYKKAENYLLKKGILKNKFIESEKPNIFFTSSISDHFWNISILFITLIDKFIDSCIKELETLH